MNAIKKIKEKHENALFQIPDVTAVGIGYLTDDKGDDTKDIGIIIYYDTSDAKPPSQLPEMLDGIKTQTRPSRMVNLFQEYDQQEELTQPPDNYEERRIILPDNPRTVKFNPMIGGISANPDFFYISPKVGTIGLIVRDNLTGGPLIMSNRHVIAGKKPNVGDGVSQPAREILGDLAADLVKWEQGNVTISNTENGVITNTDYGMDVAIARPSNGRTATIGKIYALLRVVVGDADPTLSLKVRKSGLTTGVTIGEIESIGVTLKVEDILFKNLFVIKSTNPSVIFSAPGDSGSAVLDNTRNVVGLLFASNESNTRAMASPIRPILKHLNCSVI